MNLRLTLLLAAVLLSLSSAYAQGVDKLPEHPPVATVRFECVWEAATPQDFIVLAGAMGDARYFSRNPTAPAQPQNTRNGAINAAFLPDYHVEFTLSPGSQAKIFKLANQANFFKGDFDFKKHPVANTGTKTLTYADPGRHSETTYNWSENSAIDQLTHLFEGISTTLEHGRRLEFLHRYDKLGLEDELKAMEDAAQSHYLAEIQAIKPVLEKVAGDTSVLNIARQRARRLLEMAGKETAQNAAR